MVPAAAPQREEVSVMYTTPPMSSQLVEMRKVDPKFEVRIPVSSSRTSIQIQRKEEVVPGFRCAKAAKPSGPTNVHHRGEKVVAVPEV